MPGNQELRAPPSKGKTVQLDKIVNFHFSWSFCWLAQGTKKFCNLTFEDLFVDRGILLKSIETYCGLSIVRDRRVQQDQELQIMAGSAAEPIFHPHLQELMVPVTIQLQRYVNEVCMTGLDMLIQRTAQPEPPQAVPPKEQKEQLRLHREWARKPTFGVKNRFLGCHSLHRFHTCWANGEQCNRHSKCSQKTGH